MRKILLSLAIICGVMALQAQIITLGVSTETSVTGCAVSVYDNGGLNENYSPNMDNYVTICSTDPNNHSVRVNLDLASFDVDCSDTLFIYDGPSVNDPLLVALTNCITDSITSPVLSYAATVYNTSGCLTIRFVTDGQNEGAGFAINTDCVRPCQRINVTLDPVASNKFPHLEDDGYLYLDVCPYDTIHLVAHGEYVDNDYSYHQSDATSTFHWDMSWEEIDSLGGNAIDYLFPQGRGYDIAISISDSAGCESYIPFTFRVRTSSNPIREVLDFPAVCAGSEVELTVGYDYLSALQVDTVGSEQLTSLSVTDTIFLPDGQDCGSGCSYVSPVTFTSFSPNATIQSPNDILFVRISLEHSYVGDIWIRLTCPNQQYVSIMKKMSGGSSSCSGQIPASEWGWNTTGSGYSFFGQYWEPDGSDKCNPNQNPMGNCWNYCWSNATNQGYQYSPGGYVYATSNQIYNAGVNGNSGSTFLDSTNVAAMTNVFHPDGSFANLVGCPMNGTWSIEVMDGYSSDNGYICGWEIALDPALLPQDWSYNVLVDSSWVVGPGADGPVVVPDSAGLITYQLFVQDELGCIYDTINHMEVVGHPEPDLGPDFNICYGHTTTLAANYTQGGAEGQTTQYRWNTGDNTDEIEVLTAGDYIVNITTTGENGLSCSGTDTINIDIFERPVMDVDLPDLQGCAPLNLRIENHSTPEDSQFEWYILDFDDFGNQHVAYSSLQSSPVFQFNDPGTYSIVLKMTTPDGCQDSIAMWNAIVVNPQPIAEFEADPSVSMLSESGGVVNFINYADPDIVSGEHGSFYWDFDDGTIDSVNFSDPHTFTSWGDYNVTLHVQSNSGCSSEITHTITIEQDLIFPNVITPNGDGINDVFAIENLNTNVNPEDPDGYRNNRLVINDRWGKKVYDVKNYDTYAKDGTIYPGEHIFDGSSLDDGVYYYSFQYKGKAKTITFNGSITIVR